VKTVNKKFSALVIEDEEYFRRTIVNVLKNEMNVIEATNEEEALLQLKKNDFDLVIIDINLHGKNSGLKLLKLAKAKDLYSIMLTDQDDEKIITEAYKIGCHHYLTKDQSESVLKFIIKDRISDLEGSFTPTFFKKEYVTEHTPLVHEISFLKKRLMNNKSLLILGPTGTGKTKLAEIIHTMSGGTDKNFVALNVSSISENLLESELFGHAKGSFTGAHQDKKGMLELANGGTLFLDEVASMPLSIQKKLLKALEEKTFYPVGSTKIVRVNFKIITATCEDIYKLIQENQFRLDLFYRINGAILTIPALSERTEDIPVLVKHFIKCGSRRVVVSDEAMDILKKYSWPGNIRELKSVVENLSTTEEGMIQTEHLPLHIQQNRPLYENKLTKNFLTEEQINYTLKNGILKFMDKIQAEMIFEILKQNGNKQSATEKKLKISHAGFYKMMVKAKKNLANKNDVALEENTLVIIKSEDEAQIQLMN